MWVKAELRSALNCVIAGLCKVNYPQGANLTYNLTVGPLEVNYPAGT